MSVDTSATPNTYAVPDTGSRGSSCLRHAASEICRVINTAAALVFRYLRVRAQRPRAINFSIGPAMACDELIWGFPVFHPLLKRGHCVETVGKEWQVVHKMQQE